MKKHKHVQNNKVAIKYLLATLNLARHAEYLYLERHAEYPDCNFSQINIVKMETELMDTTTAKAHGKR